MRIGAIFCHVNRTNPIGQLRFIIIVGNHQWQGVIPSFASNLRIIAPIMSVSVRTVSIGRVCVSIMVMITALAHACVIKYFITDSALL